MVDEEVLELSPAVFGRAKAPAGTWASCIRIIDPVEVCNILPSTALYIDVPERAKLLQSLLSTITKRRFLWRWSHSQHGKTNFISLSVPPKTPS